MYVADVGQNAWEYVHVVDTRAVVAEGGAVTNLGWPIFEGFRCNTDSRTFPVDQDVCESFRTITQFPIFEYANLGGTSGTKI